MDNWLNLEKTFGEEIGTSLSKRLKLQRQLYDQITNEATDPGIDTIQDQIDTSRFYTVKDASSQLNYSKKYLRGL